MMPFKINRCLKMSAPDNQFEKKNQEMDSMFLNSNKKETFYIGSY